ncbi:hypothetical protein [Kaistia sp. MMO-174]|uniref:hypothetical protein n=1 Tax=Kaistia sp. MMO-174 TaxID=3081256 RepID=UPI0030165399
MSGSFIKSYRAAVAVAGYLIAKFAAPTTDTTVGIGTAGTDPLLGIADSMGAPQGGMLDVTLAGPAEVRLGGTVAAGDPITAGTGGKGVKCAPTAGTRAAYVAIALAPGVADDIIPVRVSPGFITTPA